MIQFAFIKMQITTTKIQFAFAVLLFAFVQIQFAYLKQKKPSTPLDRRLLTKTKTMKNTHP
jgi:hypothetical protein